ncbi:hypothetical protein ABPG77_006789 [Micractinium sp. CCAP 211/92]
MYQSPKSALAGASDQLLESLTRFFGPAPGSRAHQDLFFETIRLREAELRKPKGEVNEARILQLTKQKLRLEAERHQVLHRRFRATQLKFQQPPLEECCADCVRVHQRLTAVCQAAAAWFGAASLRANQQLQAVERGEPLPAVPLPPFKLQLPEGVAEELPPSLDRCSRCQNMLNQYLKKEEEIRLVVAVQNGGTPMGA